MAADATLYIQTRLRISTRLEIEPAARSRAFRSRLDGMYLEVNSNAYVPAGWPYLFPVRDWREVNIALSREGSTDPQITSTIYLNYIGEETHTIENIDQKFSTMLMIKMSGKVNAFEEPTDKIHNMTAYVSYDLGESWGIFFSIGEIKMWGGYTTDFLAQTLAVAGCRLGVLKDGLYGKFVFDNTFMNEYNQLWLEDPAERDPTKGGVGIAPIFDAPTVLVEDERNRLAVHSGTWGVIRSSNKIVAATNLLVGWCQNSDEPKVPVVESPFCYCVNMPKEIMWIGPLAYLSVQDHPDYHDYFTGPPQWRDEYTTVLGEEEQGLAGQTIWWTGDGMVLGGTGSGGPFIDNYYSIGWSSNPGGPGLKRAYYAPDYRWSRVQYNFPYVSYVHPTSTTVFIMKGTKTQGDVSVWHNQKLSGNDQIHTGTYFEQALRYWETGGGWFGEYGYKFVFDAVGDPYGTSVWTFSAFKKHMQGLRPYALDVGHKIVSEWGGIVRNVIRYPSERDYWNNRPFDYKNRDMASLQCNVIGEYEINGRYNNMKTALYGEFVDYFAAFDKLFIAEEAPGIDDTGNTIFEYFPSNWNPKHYGVSIIPSKSFGNVIYGIKQYREKTHYITRKQKQNYHGGPTYSYRQDQYGMQNYGPVVSENGGVSWHDVDGLSDWNKTIPTVQFKPIYLGNNQWICEHNAKLYKSFTGIGWSPLTQVLDVDEESKHSWKDQLDPSLDQENTFLLDCPCRNEYLAVHQYTGLPTGIANEDATVIDRSTLKAARYVLSVDSVWGMSSSGIERLYPVDSISDQIFINLASELASDTVSVRITYQTKSNVARLFHVVTNPTNFNLTHIIKDLSFVGDNWEPKVDMNFQSPYDPIVGWKCAITSLSGGILTHLYHADPFISANEGINPQEANPLIVHTTDIPQVIFDEYYLKRIEVSGGTGDYKYHSPNLPYGLSVNADGEINGIPITGASTGSLDMVVDDSTSPAYSDPDPPPSRIEFPNSASIYGYIMDTTGQPRQGATVTVKDVGTGAITTQVQTNENGRYTAQFDGDKPFQIFMENGQAVGSTLFSKPKGTVSRLDGNVGNSTAGTTNIGVGVNFYAPFDQTNYDIKFDGAMNIGTIGVGFGYQATGKDDRGPEYIDYRPKNARIVVGGEASFRFYFAYTEEAPDAEAAGAFFFFNSAHFPPDFAPAMNPVKMTVAEIENELGGLPGGLLFGENRMGLAVDVTGTVNPINNGVPYTQPTALTIGAIRCVDLKGREAVSSVMTFTAVPLAGEESVPPTVEIYSPSNYSTVTGSTVKVKGRAADSSGIHSITVGGTEVEIPPSNESVMFEATIGELNPGTNAIDVTATDASLRRNTTSKKVYVTYGTDNQGPDLEVSQPDSEDVIYVFSHDYEIVGNATDGGKGDSGVKEIRIGAYVIPKTSADGADSVNFSYLKELSLGLNQISITAEDYRGNTTTVQRKIHRHEDSVGPNISLSSPVNNPIVSYGSYHTIQGSVSDGSYGDNGVASLTMDGTALKQPNGNSCVVKGSASVNFERRVGLDFGYNVFNIVAKDELGNTSTLAVEITRMAP